MSFIDSIFYFVARNEIIFELTNNMTYIFFIVFNSFVGFLDPGASNYSFTKILDLR